MDKLGAFALGVVTGGVTLGVLSFLGSRYLPDDSDDDDGLTHCPDWEDDLTSDSPVTGGFFESTQKLFNDLAASSFGNAEQSCSEEERETSDKTETDPAEGKSNAENATCSSANRQETVNGIIGQFKQAAATLAKAG